MAARPEWDPRATEILEAVLRAIPFLIRGPARAAAIAEAERNAKARRRSTISRDDAIVAMIAVTPADWRDTLRRFLESRSIDTKKFRKHFEQR